MAHPRSFNIGLVLLWVSIGLQALKEFIIYFSYNAVLGSWLLSVAAAVPVASVALLAYYVSKGKNWARIALLIGFLIFLLPRGLLGSIPVIMSWLNGVPDGADWQILVSSGLAATAAALQTAALLVFFSKPSSRVFVRAGP